MIASGGVWGLRLVVVTLFLSIGEATTGNWEWRRMYVYENKETSPGGDKIGTLSNAKFKDNKAKYMYRISGEGANTIFTVNDYGDIFVNVQLDREKKSVYNLNARLVERENSDKDVEAPSDFAIHVQDINDEAPVFHEPFKGSIQEMSPIGTTVMTINATDNDDPTTVHAMIEFKLLNGTDVFNIDKKGIITTKVANLDRESTSEYRIMVLAKDQPGQSIGHKVNQVITISLTDINDNLSTFKTEQYTFNVKEDAQVGFEIGRVEVDDKDEEQNKRPEFKIEDADISHLFEIKQDPHKNGVFTLRQPLDYESKSIYKFKLSVIENLVTFPGLQGTPHKADASIIIKVLDVDEPPHFDQKEYNITVDENKIPGFLGSVSAKDPDTINHPIRYSIEDSSCPVRIDEVTGQLSLRWELDRELAPVHRCQVTAEEQAQDGMKGYAMLNLWVRDVNDNAPKLHTEDIYVCESDGPGTVVGILTATDKDETNGRFTFMLDKRSSNFSLSDNNNGTATLRVKEGGFSTEDSGEHVVEVKVNDGKHDSIESLRIRVCTCDRNRIREYCRPGRRQVGVSMHALITILLCIVTILVIVILLVLRRRYQKESVALGKMSGEIHEQLVTYDEEGGGEMDTNGYDVSILTSARHDASLLPGPGLYAMVNKPQACKGDMAAMIEVKKDEADHDRDGYPYDTLHIYGYEGPGSLAGSLSSLGSSSSGDSLDYDFLNEWGPRFRTLAELYGVDCYPGDCPY